MWGVGSTPVGPLGETASAATGFGQAVRPAGLTGL